ncbi:MAG: hypothetical protein JWP27_548 [Flaviaesturariibacter sp.]|nr:hypothetical protein [Flaviaesturariibacter sp.]
MRIKYLSSIALASLMFAGCLKNKGNNFTIQDSPASSTVSFPNQEESAALDIQTAPTTYTFYVEATSTNNSHQGGTITIAKDAAAVAAAGYEMLPDSAYSLVSTTSTIDPVTHLAPFQLKVNTTKIAAGHDYAVAYKIVSTTNGATIAANKNKILIAVGAKNKFDGLYTLKIKTTGWAAFGIADNVSGTYPGDYELITSGTSSVEGNAVARGDYLLPAFTNTMAATAFGATTPEFIFDPVTNKLVNVRNTTPPDSRNRTLEINPAVTTSRWDPTTRNIYASFIMKQTGRPDQVFYDTLLYLGPRP